MCAEVSTPLLGFPFLRTPLSSDRACSFGAGFTPIQTRDKETVRSQPSRQKWKADERNPAMLRDVTWEVNHEKAIPIDLYDECTLRTCGGGASSRSSARPCSGIICPSV